MKKLLLASLIASTALVAPAAQAQDADVAALRAQIDALQAQVAQMSARLDQMEDTAETPAPAPAVAPAPAPAPVATPAAAAPPAPTITFRGAPEISAAGGWTFKPFGRLNMDVGTTALPDALNRSEGIASELRRARLGVEGTIPGGFGYKVELEFAGGTELTDAVLTYNDGGLTVTAGQQNNFQGLEELTSSRWNSFIERAAFTDAFNFQRRLGLSAQYVAGDVIVQGGVFSDNVVELPSNNWGLDGRIVYAPKVGDTQLHLAGSLHLTDLQAGSTVRYRQRPLVHFTAERPLATPTFGASSELGFGLEGALISGRFHAVAEGYWQDVRTPGAAPDAGFFGGYAEVGLYLTDDRRGYRGGRWDRSRPDKGIDEGGSGSFEINLRYDYLDLNDGTLRGGTQDGYMSSLVWVPTDYTRLSLSYAHLEYGDAVIALPGGDRSWSADVLGLRGQIDF